jgi:hypothetical protein
MGALLLRRRRLLRLLLLLLLLLRCLPLVSCVSFAALAAQPARSSSKLRLLFHVFSVAVRRGAAAARAYRRLGCCCLRIQVLSGALTCLPAEIVRRDRLLSGLANIGEAAKVAVGDAMSHGCSGDSIAQRRHGGNCCNAIAAIGLMLCWHHLLFHLVWYSAVLSAAYLSQHMLPQGCCNFFYLVQYVLQHT